MRIQLPLAALLALAACGPSHTTSLGKMGGAPPSVLASTQLLGPNGELRGTATLTQEPDGVRVSADVSSLPPGPYAIHLHAVGRCDPPDFKTAGGHFNPAMKQHGMENPMGSHAGDLPNITVNADGKGHLVYDRPSLRLIDGDAPLLDADGAAVVLHAGPDDYRTDPAGNAGARIACGVLSRR
jgi:Cu-Zn family superoxide dismutase